MTKNYVELLNYYLDNYKDNTMFEYLDDDFQVQKISYESFYKKVHTVINFINEKKIKKQKIALCMKNCYQWFVYYYAIVASGNIAVLVPIEADIESHKRMISKTETEYLFASNVNKYTVGNIFEARQEIEETDGTIPETDIGFEEMVAIVFTSGTSGQEKAVCLSNKNCLFSVNTAMTKQAVGDEKERRFHTLPYAHIGGITVASEFAAGNCLCEYSEAKYFLKALKKYSPNSLSITPMYMKLLVKQILIKQDVREILGESCKTIICASAILEKKDRDILVNNGISITDAYGMSETTGMGAYKVFVGNMDMIVGGVFKNVSMEIIDGEVVIGGDCVMMGYYNDQEETDNILKDGKIYTGDIGHFEQNGTLTIDGRKKNLIILSNGENISPESIENEIQKCEKIKECRVYGKDDKICIDIALNNVDDKKQVLTYIEDYNKKNSFNKRILGIDFVHEIKRNSMGKIVR